jgi:hypothetical protein
MSRRRPAGTYAAWRASPSSSFTAANARAATALREAVGWSQSNLRLPRMARSPADTGCRNELDSAVRASEGLLIALIALIAPERVLLRYLDQHSRSAIGISDPHLDQPHGSWRGARTIDTPA